MWSLQNKESKHIKKNFYECMFVARYKNQIILLYKIKKIQRYVWLIVGLVDTQLKLESNFLLQEDHSLFLKYIECCKKKRGGGEQAVFTGCMFVHICKDKCTISC